jgi:hypothetical protein
MKLIFLILGSVLLSIVVLRANASSSIETECSDTPMPIEGSSIIELEHSNGPWVIDQHGGFLIKVPFKEFRMIVEYRRTELFLNGRSTEGPEQFLAAFESRQQSKRDIRVEDLIPSSDEIRAHWSEYEQSDGYGNPDAFDASSYSKAVSHAYEPIALINYALQNGTATVIDASGANIDQVTHYWYSGLDEEGDKVQGVSFKTMEGLEVFSTCHITPVPKS